MRVRLDFGKSGREQRGKSFEQLLSEADELRDARDFNAAASAYAVALKLRPGRTDLRVQYANMLKDSGQFGQAVEQYTHCLREEPDKWDTHLQLARAELQLNAFDEARYNLDAALRLQPDAAPVRALLDQLDRRDPGPPPQWDANTVEIGLEAALSFSRRHGLIWRSTDRAALSAIASTIQTDREASSTAPAVSVVVIVRGQTLSALSCLEALAAHRARLTFEVIVIDDHSPAYWETGVIAEISWLHYERANERLGLASAAAKARKLARGRVLAFLDPTTRVCAGWLDNLVASRTAYPLAGRSLDNLVGVEGVALAPGLDGHRGALLVDATSSKVFGKLLVVDHYVPEPDRDAGSRNMLDLMTSLQVLGWTVAFWPLLPRVNRAYERQLRERGIDLLHPAWTGVFEDWFARNRADVDLVLLSRPTVAPSFLHTIRRFSSVPVLFYGHDLHSARMRAEARLKEEGALERLADEMEGVERRLWRNVTVSLYPSKDEADAARQMEPGGEIYAIVPFCFDAFRGLRRPPNTKTVLFVANFSHAPNVDAACWLACHVMPAVWGAHPGAKLSIVGSDPTEAVRALAGEAVEVVGSVSSGELQIRYDNARVAVVPLRFGAGVKLKVVEALHEGLPLVTTPTGAQGLPDLSEAVIIGQEACELAQGVNALLGDDSLWISQSARQLAYAERMFSRSASVSALSAVVEVATRTLKPAYARSHDFPCETDALRATAMDVGVTDSDFIAQVYLGLLGREADASGAAHYLDEIRRGTLTREQFVGVVERSDEYKSRRVRRSA